MRFRRNGGWQQRSYAELADAVQQTAAGLRALGLGPGDRIGLIAGTRLEWTVFDLAIGTLGAVCVPVYPTNSRAECAWLLSESGARAVVCENDEQRAKIASVRGELPDLRHVVLIEGENPAAISLAALRARSPRGDAERARVAAGPCPNPDQVATVVYTSGTTGLPKACSLTNRNWRAALDAIGQRATTRPGDVTYLYLPLAHVFGRAVQLATLEAGATLVYFGGDARRVLAELAQVRPTRLPSVPRLFEKVYAAATAELSAEEMTAAVRLGAQVRPRLARGEPVDPAALARFEAAERRLFAPVRAAFGGRVAGALCTTAPVAAQVLEFFAACGVPVHEAYGLTEATALVCANPPGAARPGTVGRPLPGVQVRIGAGGQVLVRGDCVFEGYLGDRDAAAGGAAAGGAGGGGAGGGGAGGGGAGGGGAGGGGAAAGGLGGVCAGWLHTGDLGSLDADGYLRITGPAAEVMVTAAGDDIAPAALESRLRCGRWISHAVLLGDRRPYLVALITLDADQILPWARGQGLPESIPALSRHPAVVRAVQHAVDVANDEQAPPERVSGFAILDHDFSVEAGELTPTLRVRRTVVADRYADVLDRLYAGDG